MSALFVKPREKICRERARIAASEKYDKIIREKRDEYSKTRNVKLMQDIIKLSRQKDIFKAEAFNYHMENYILAEDSISDTVPEEDRKKYGLEAFNNYLSEELLKI